MKHTLSTRNLVLIAMFAAIAAILMYLEFPVIVLAPQFYKLDFSEVPVLIGAFAMGPMAGVLIEFLKILIHLIIKGTTTAYVGEMANFIVGISFILPAALIYGHRKTRKRAYMGLAAGTACLAVFGCLMNAYILLPWYAANFFAAAGGMDALVQAGTMVHPSIDTVWELVLLCVGPFNLLKGILVSVLTAFLYKKISFLIKHPEGL